MRTASLLLVSGIAAIVSGCGRRQVQSDPLRDADLKAYTHCAFADGLEIVEQTPLASGVTGRTVDTASGAKVVRMVSGVRIMFAYPGTDFFANVKAEKLPDVGYGELKQALIDNFDFILKSSPSNDENRSPVAGMKKLDGRGLDHNKLEGGVIGMYLLFNDRRHVATTVYLLNQDPSRRRFQTLGEYTTLRNRFLSTYVSCIDNNLR